MSNNDGPKHPDRAADTIRWDQLNPSDARIIERGRKAFRHLTADRTWNDWLEIGEALMVGRTASMQAARANTPHGRVYNRVFGRWLHDYGFGEIDKADRTRLLACLEHRTAIEEWRAELPLRKRLRFNHPATVWRNWKASKEAVTVKPKRSPIADLKASVVRLSEENEFLRRQLGGKASGTRGGTPSEIARTLFDQLPASDVKTIAQLLLDLVETDDSAWNKFVEDMLGET